MNTTQQTLSPLAVNTTHTSAAGTLYQVQEPGSDFDRVPPTLSETAFKPLTPPSPVNDIFLCPPLTNARFRPRQFDTPEEEEAWWSDPRTYPGDHLVAADNAPLSLSFYDTTPCSYITSPSPEPSEREDSNHSTYPSQIRTTHFRPVHSCQNFILSDESDGSEIDFFSDDDDDLETSSKAGQDISTHAMSNPCAQPSPRTRDGGSYSEELEGLSDDEDVDSDSESDDEYSPDAAGPAHRTRASHTRRAALRRKSVPRTKGVRTYKSRTTRTKPKDIKPPPKRRDFISIPLQELKLLRGKENLLRASRKKPPPFELPKPIRLKANSWRCPHIQDGERCTKISSRSPEADRHLLTHFRDLRFLCINPQCPLAFARKDSMKRHVNSVTECKNKKNHPPLVTMDDYKGTAVKEGEVYRLVRLVYNNRGALKSKSRIAS